jgi:1-deoxy-D-xylulose-5-phosphate reductoisomerase
MQTLAILGSTGSIGRQTLEVVAAFPKDFKVEAMAAKDEIDLILEQIEEFRPSLVSVADQKTATALSKSALIKNLGKKAPKIITGSKSLTKIATYAKAKTIVVAIPGGIAVEAAYQAALAGKTIALATKEVLVADGDRFMSVVRKKKLKVFPIDSEHSAIAQCLNGENIINIKRIIITASGGPFRETPKEKLAQMTAKEALAHPTWKMGPKITVDSATLMNKGFEVIEAHYLFDLPFEKIEVVVHPQSVIHSMVEFVDGSIVAQLGAPDMRVPIQHALFEGKRKTNDFKRLNLEEVGKMTFFTPDFDKFPCLEYAYAAGSKGSKAGKALNDANDAAVADFLAGKIKFTQIAERIQKAIARYL